MTHTHHSSRRKEVASSSMKCRPWRMIASNDLTTAVAVVQLMRTLLVLLIQWRERQQQLREEGSNGATHPRTTTDDEMLETPTIVHQGSVASFTSITCTILKPRKD
ncbi:Hypothetical protein, putative [Bodo saltans]|uniref:Uncharacterized protein n=1 Tax=Bodo saltans TaxID=75058 RepID=A0A0S4JW35_BODSA|nr:Hypothetical protein, putative [Bodo saltans]|eukprot:CUG93629.1 Hypothetical protein, putative [Bodo saltans]